MSGSSMYKTKLCIMFDKNGHCTRPNCPFAHGTAELRGPRDSSFTGRHHDSDLRNRLGRQFSPERRPFLERSGRREQRFSGHENPRSFDMRRDRNYRESHRFDERVDDAGGLKVGNRIEDRAEDGPNKFQGYDNVPDEQEKAIELHIEALTDEKLQLEASVERKEREAVTLTSRIDELETQLNREKEECRRITSRTKKFVKEYNRFLRAQDDLKRSEARLQKLGQQLSMSLTGNERNDRDAADIDIVSDEENNGLSLRTGFDSQNTSPPSRKRQNVDQYTTKERFEDALIGRGEEEKAENMKISSRRSKAPSKSYREEETGVRKNEETVNKYSSKDENWKRRRLSSGTSSSNKVMTSTSMAAQVYDEENHEAANGYPLESLPPPPPLPPAFRDSHFEGEDRKVNVDVIKQSKGNDVDSV